MFVNPQSIHEIHCGCSNTITIIEGKELAIKKPGSLNLKCMCGINHTVALRFNSIGCEVLNAHILDFD